MEEAAVKCTQNFCPFCCGDKIPGNMLTETKLCIDECDKVEEPSEHADFTQCYESSDPEHSYGLFCELSYQGDEEKYNKNYCQRDLCQSCCVTLPLVIGQDVAEKSMKDCQEKCKNKFMLV
jgi:hypothetical protein